MPGKLLPNRTHVLPKIGHVKDDPYVDYPIVYNDTLTEEVFYVDHDFTFVSSSPSNTTLYKWTGGSWLEVLGLNNPDVLYGRGFYAVTTIVDCYVAITEHTNT